MKNLDKFNLNTHNTTQSFIELDDKAKKVKELELKLSKYKKLGRPKSKKPPTKQMTLYLADDEMEFLNNQAKAKGLTKNQIIRNLIIEKIK